MVDMGMALFLPCANRRRRDRKPWRVLGAGAAPAERFSFRNSGSGLLLPCLFRVSRAHHDVRWPGPLARSKSLRFAQFGIEQPKRMLGLLNTLATASFASPSGNFWQASFGMKPVFLTDVSPFAKDIPHTKDDNLLMNQP